MEVIPFDPSRYLTKVRGNDYLEVKWRIVWFRDVYPNGTIDTEIIHLDPEQRSAVIKATAVAIDADGSVCGRATGLKEGTPTANIPDYIELGETGAIGRALAALGFGTQFCPDHDYGGENGQVVDAPVNRGQQRQGGGEPVAFRQANDNGMPSPKQAGFIQAISRELRMNAQALNEFTQRLVGKDADQLSRRDASTVIEALKEQQNARGFQGDR